MARTTDKADYGLDVFRAEPPEDDATAVKLMVGRDEVVKRAYQDLRRGWDKGGRKAKRGRKHPWLIEGETRSGKSHLARCLFARFKDDGGKCRKIQVPARARGDAVTVIHSIFELLRDEFFAYYNNELSTNLVGQAYSELTCAVISGFDSFFGPGGVPAENVKVTTSRETTDTMGTEAAIFHLAAKFQQSSKAAGATELTLRPPSPVLLAEVCGTIVDTLHRAGLLDHLLILVDDVDLLAPYEDPEHTGRATQAHLAAALCELHRAPCVDVVVTGRSWYAILQKEFTSLVDLVDAPMTVAQLAEVHDRRLKMAVGRRSLPKEFLELGALEEAATLSSFLPGVFLQHLDAAFTQWGREEDDWTPRSLAWYLDFWRRRWDAYREFAPVAAERLAAAVAAGELVVDVTDGNFVADTRFDNVFAFQSYWNEKMYTIPPLARRILIEPGAEA